MDPMPESPALPPMEETAAVTTATSVESLFQRRIEFHPARKPFSTISSRDFHLETLNPSAESLRKATPAAAAVSPGMVVSSRKRSEGGEFYEHGFDPELSFRITFRRIGAGLENLGNTCFLNSVVQCLTYTEPFAAYLQSGKHKSSCHIAGFCAMCALQSHVKNALQSSGKSLSPSILVQNLRCISRNFHISRQEDAHEYMVNLLESMHKCCLPSGVPSESPSAYEKSLVHKIFGGRLRSQVKCMQCSSCSNKFDPFLDLSLEILKADSLHKALKHFTAVEQLDGGEKQYQCQFCKQKVRALKQLTVHKAPYVLAIHLKRFGSYVGQKIDKKVQFGPTLDLKPFMSDTNGGDLKYTLYGVLVHAGWSTHSGHYYCFVRTSTGMWHALDDNQVFQVSEKTVLEQKAYMLFYVRDRSSGTKRPVDLVHKENVSANAPQSKMIFTSAANGCASAVSKADLASNRRPFSVISNSSEHHSDKGPSLQSSGYDTLKEASIMPNNSHMKHQVSVLQTNGNVLGKELRQNALSKNSTLSSSLSSVNASNNKLVKENLGQSVFKATTSDNAHFIPKMAEINLGKSDTEVRARVIVSGNFDAEPKSSDLLNVTSEMHNEGVLKENGTVENAAADASENGDAFCLSVHDKKITGNMDPSHLSAKSEREVPLRQASTMNGCIRTDALSTEAVDHQLTNVPVENTAHENDKNSSNQPCQKDAENLHGLKEELISSSKETRSLNVHVQEETLAIVGKEHSVSELRETKLKAKKPVNLLVGRGIWFGRRELFLKSLGPRKSKHKKSKKRHSRACNATSHDFDEGGNGDANVASTSEAVRIVLDSNGSSKKRSRSCSKIETKICGEKDVDQLKGDPGNTRDRATRDEGCSKSTMLSTIEQSKPCLTSVANENNRREASTSNNSGPRDFISLLTRGLEETTVARWDNIDLPSSQIHGLKGAESSSIGYVLDEWDEEYDRGKQKKVKKNKYSFGGANLFQETASIKAQQKMKGKMNRRSSGSKPFRI